MFVSVKGYFKAPFGSLESKEFIINTDYICTIEVDKKIVWFANATTNFIVVSGFEKLVQALNLK